MQTSSVEDRHVPEADDLPVRTPFRQEERTVLRGESHLSPEVEQQIETDPPVPELTPRQKDVLASMVKGLSNPDIAHTLGIRRDGVAEHVNAILQKIGAANRTEAVAIGVRKQLLKI